MCLLNRIERFSRTVKLIGEEAFKRLESSKVAVFGIGGVGSYVVEALARAGVGEFLLIDGDYIVESNINRQIHALESSLGKSKVETMKARALDINPNAKVQTMHAYFPFEMNWDSGYDYVIDAVDDVSAKIEIIINSKSRGIPVISSMGAGNKLHPEMFRIADIYDTKVCPLARVMRRELRARGIEDVKVVYSEETPVEVQKALGNGMSDCFEKNAPGSLGKEAPGSVSFVPAAAGLIIAGEVIRTLCK